MPTRDRGSVAGTDRSGDGGLLALFDALGRRWSLRVVWELGYGDATYRDLATRIPGMSTSVLTDRLRELRAAGLVGHEHGQGYRLTQDGRDLIALLGPLAEWADRAGFAASLGSD